MAKVIYRLWEDDNKDTMILPGSLPLFDGGSRNELTYHLSAGWDPVIEGDIDGERAETTELENKEPRFGAVQAARRVARTLFLGSAPSSAVQKSNARGLDRPRVIIGVYATRSIVFGLFRRPQSPIGSFCIISTVLATKRKRSRDSGSIHGQISDARWKTARDASKTKMKCVANWPKY